MCALQYRSQHRALQNAIRHFVFADESDSELERAITAIDGGRYSLLTPLVTRAARLQII